MSNSTRLARPDRSEAQLIKDTFNRRPLFSSMSVLVGTGVVALSALPSSAHAKSALDEMAWLPQHTQLTNNAGAVLNAASAPVARAVAVTPASLPASRPVITEAQAVPVVVHRVAEAAPRSRGFADAGIVPSAQQWPDENDAATADVVRTGKLQVAVAAPQVAPAVEQVRTPLSVHNATPARIGVSTSPMRPAATAVVSAGPPHDMQADLQTLRGVVATSAVVLEDQQAALARPNRIAAVASRALPVTGAADTAFAASGIDTPVTKGRRVARSTDQGYADWLDDSAGAKAQADRSVVPEQAVRAALRSAAETAAARSAAIRQARNDWEAAKFDVDQVKGQRWPQVQVAGNSPSLNGSGGNRFDDSNRSTAQINVTTMVYDWGKTSKNIDSRIKTAEAAELYYKTVEQQNAYEVSSNLVELAKNRAVYGIGASYVKRMSALVDMLAEIVKVDPGRLSELSQAKARLLQAQTSQQVVADQLRSLELSVYKLVGDQATPMPTGTRWQLRLDGLGSAVDAVAQNPAIEQAAAEAAAASATAKSVRAGSLPQLNWVINKTTANDSWGNRQPWTTMLQLSWTPFQGGSQRAAERAALSRASSSSDKREQLQLDAEFKVRDAHRDVIALSERTKMYGDLSAQTDLVRKQFFEQWYHLNRRTLVDVLLAESDFYNNQVSEVSTQFDAYQSILKIRLNNGTLEQWLQET
jgi:outer membrane protein, adhesin transport system